MLNAASSVGRAPISRAELGACLELASERAGGDLHIIYVGQTTTRQKSPSTKSAKNKITSGA
eukprot:scaffold2790_cov118-Skeletonema_dohrnii-CCMP3373.AAC.3